MKTWRRWWHEYWHGRREHCAKAPYYMTRADIGADDEQMYPNPGWYIEWSRAGVIVVFGPFEGGSVADHAIKWLDYHYKGRR